MEFHEKLQLLRKNKGLTQEELADILYVSRTAISKWESDRGYPNIDSLKRISTYFEVSIDDLLSGEKLIYIAENEHRARMQNICQLLHGIADIFVLLLIILPLYPMTVGDYVYSVNLWNYTETAVYNLWIYWALFLLLVLVGICKILLNCLGIKKGRRWLANGSLLLSIITILYLVLTREAYGACVLILLMVVKCLLEVQGRKHCR
ncbi:MAG: helix-turn-helix transcriptional regulator [Agathobacter sp.]|nr:helix-turn-helix transcriptional regulator [Agathobacter sp.]